MIDGSRDVPHAARLYHRLLAFTFLVAWASLGSQILVLVGRRGLLPARQLVDALALRPDVGFLEVPTLFRFFCANDGVLSGGVVLGVVCSGLALAGIFPRVFSAAATLLYLSYAVVCRNFLSFQWDNLLLECGALAVFLPTRRRVPWIYFLLRFALFKLYFESGLAKYESVLGDWKDGSAMRYYYETAPLPTRLAWYAHALPAKFHALESWGALAFELGVPFLIFFGRRGRRVASVVFAGFQTLNILTANYGFFSYLALVLQVMLLDDTDVIAARRALGALMARLRRAVPGFPWRALRRSRAIPRLVRLRSQPLFVRPRRWASGEDARTLVFLGRLWLALTVAATYIGVSVDGAEATFAPGAPRSKTLESASAFMAPVRLVNTYHLFSSITRERIEPTFETFDGDRWTFHDLHFKPGDPRRPPPFVAPHQPRVDFLLWFYGLSHEQSTPLYVRNLVQRLCTDPAAVASLFVDRLPEHPAAAGVTFYRYHFTTREERSRTGAWWTRELVPGEHVLDCAPASRTQPE